ncbi:MAG: Y-family DNA polymerase [Proteobacteria bacterium]|nr:Y-family DNA polymerase [Pseudomonadota bacterium]
MAVYAILDCNNFYASCERLFNPTLNEKPIVVLSNNDGCIIARSNEAKALGIGMGEPYFKAKGIIEQNDVAVFSSNYTLYGDMSRRVMSTVKGFIQDVEVYSIDEVFMDLSSFPEPERFCRDIRTAVTRWTGIPVSIGIGESKTLAKVANRISKKYKSYSGVFNIDSDERRLKVLKATAVGDVWGIGRQLNKRLTSVGINTAYDLSVQADSWVRKSMSVVGLRTVHELRGEACIEIEQVTPAKKMINVSRSFGQKIYDRSSVKEALANFTERAAEKLRGEGQLVKKACISLYRELAVSGKMHYKDVALISLPYPTDSTIEILQYVSRAFEEIFVEGQGYKKCGITLVKLQPKSRFVKDLFDMRDINKHDSLMQAIDSINGKMGSHTLQMASSRGAGKWVARKDCKSYCYTTRWDELPLVH